MNTPKIDLNQTTEVTCDKCGGVTFQEAMQLRKVSALLTGTGQPGLVPIPVFCCSNCGHVNEEFLPRELKMPKLD